MALNLINDLKKKSAAMSKELEEVRLEGLALKGENTTLKEELDKEKQANESRKMMLKDAQSA
eukprot:CAMPEP_0176443052 /NCGR_PEP_ID=MMETSP0127-20121128/22191_1 /TAXON_ID=938130 /ORGANISM="Platyophrya macrostoma, Strain WH" /LENGTH=61 /DNA_ID=CAMNT_0017828203 /DNA_START=63 /DNA_END=244 /DNA_ORIENTATION=-